MDPSVRPSISRSIRPTPTRPRTMVLVHPERGAVRDELFEKLLHCHGAAEAEVQPLLLERGLLPHGPLEGRAQVLWCEEGGGADWVGLGVVVHIHWGIDQSDLHMQYPTCMHARTTDTVLIAPSRRSSKSSMSSSSYELTLPESPPSEGGSRPCCCCCCWPPSCDAWQLTNQTGNGANQVHHITQNTRVKRFGLPELRRMMTKWSPPSSRPPQPPGPDPWGKWRAVGGSPRRRGLTVVIVVVRTPTGGCWPVRQRRRPRRRQR